LLLLIAALAPIQSPLESGALALSYPLVYWFLLFDGWLSALPALAAFALLGYQFLSIKKTGSPLNSLKLVSFQAISFPGRTSY